MKGAKFTKGTDNVFRDLVFPEPEARNLALRSDLLVAIEKFVKSSDLTQASAAKQLGITQSRLSQLLGGHLERFSLDALVEIATNAGLHVRLVVRRAA
jgi:predicted XRE-type DNA-binding protein